MNKKTITKAWMKNTSLSREYFIFATILVSALIIASIVLSLQIYHSNVVKTKHTLQVDANRVHRVLSDTLNETNQIMIYIGKQIAKTGGKDLQIIDHLLKNTSGSEYKSSNLLSWSRFDWVGPNNLQLVNSKTGIAVNPPNMSHREYTWRSPKQPWTLQVSKPAIGNPSNLWVIPAGTGITDDKGNYLGTLVVGFDIAELTSKIDKELRSQNTSFVILDNNYNIVAHSDDTDIAGDSDYYRKLLKDKNLFTTNDQDVTDPLEYKDITYYHYTKISNYPYIILTGVDSKILNQEYYSLLLPRITEFLLVGIFGLILLYIFRRKIIKPITELSNTALLISKGNTKIEIAPQNSKEMFHLARGLLKVREYIRRLDKYKRALETSHSALKEKHKELEETKEQLESTANLVKASDEAKEEFVRRINQEMDIPLDTIITYSDVLIKQLKGHINVGINKEKQINFLEQIHESAQDLKMLTTHILDIEEIDVAKVINQCVTIHAKEALLKKIQLQTNIETNISQFYADDLRFKQIVLGLLARSIQYAPKESTINVSIKTIHNQEKPFLRLIVSDNGFGLTDTDIKRLSDKFGKGGVSRNATGTDLEFSSVEKLVRMHQGKCKVENKLGEGSSIIVTFPYLTKDEADLNDNKQAQAASLDNIVRLF